jgi:hypothetical protein
VTISPNGKTAHVYYPVAHDPAETDPARSETATIKVELNRESAGGVEYWRVSRVQFLGRQFRAPGPQVVQAYDLTLDDSATPPQVAAVTLRTLGDLIAAEKAGDKDRQASAEYRLFVLSANARLESSLTNVERRDSGELEVAKKSLLGETVGRWAQQVQTVAAVLNDPAKVTPERMQVAGASSPDAAQVVYTPEGLSPIVVEMARQSADGKTFFRVVNVTTQDKAGGAPAHSSPATQGTTAR